MKISKVTFLLYFIWSCLTIVTMAVDGLYNLHKAKLIFDVLNSLQAIHMVISLLESIVSFLLLFTPFVSKKEKLLLLPFCILPPFYFMYLLIIG